MNNTDTQLFLNMFLIVTFSKTVKYVHKVISAVRLIASFAFGCLFSHYRAFKTNYGSSAPGLSAPHLGSSAPGLICCKFCCVSLGIDRDRNRFMWTPYKGRAKIMIYTNTHERLLTKTIY